MLTPNFLGKGAVSVQTLTYMDTMFSPVAWTDIPGQIYRIGGFLGTIYHWVPFMLQSSPESGAQPSLKYARAIKKDLPAGGKLGIAGFCWGGHSSTFLCTQPSVEGGTEPLIDA